MIETRGTVSTYLTSFPRLIESKVKFGHMSRHNGPKGATEIPHISPRRKTSRRPPGKCHPSYRGRDGGTGLSIVHPLEDFAENNSFSVHRSRDLFESVTKRHRAKRVLYRLAHLFGGNARDAFFGDLVVVDTINHARRRRSIATR